MKLHIYCVVEPAQTLPDALHGVAGALVRRLEIAGLCFLVSEYSERVVPVTRENVLAHAAVIQSVLKVTTPLPFRFGTLAGEEQLQNYVNAKREALHAKLEQVRDCVEMNIKIISERDWTEVSPVINAQENPGTAFLAEKRREILGGEARAAEAERIGAWLEGEIGSVVREHDLKPNAAGVNSTARPLSKLLLAGAYLVERDRVDEFRRRAAEARAQRPELHFLVSGPWAPYSFTNIDLEFKTHFGVS